MVCVGVCCYSGLVAEQVFVLERMGENLTALSLIMKELRDVKQALFRPHCANAAHEYTRMRGHTHTHAIPFSAET